jgi:hypothetical protein
MATIAAVSAVLDHALDQFDQSRCVLTLPLFLLAISAPFVQDSHGTINVSDGF